MCFLSTWNKSNNDFDTKLKSSNFITNMCILKKYDIKSFRAICLDRNNNVLYIPCNHLAVRSFCNKQLLLKKIKNCPICRTRIITRIFCISPSTLSGYHFQIFYPFFIHFRFHTKMTRLSARRNF